MSSVDKWYLHLIKNSQIKRKRRYNKNRLKRLFRSSTWDASIVDPRLKPDVFLGASDLIDYLTSQIIIAREESDLPCFHKDFSILGDQQQWQEILLTQPELVGRVYQTRNTTGICIHSSNIQYFEYTISAGSISIKLFGDRDYVDNLYQWFTSKFQEVKNVIEWIYNTDGSTVEIPLTSDKTPIKEMYPFIQHNTLGDYYDSFMRADASILLLIGPPGTGKTTFIRGLLQHTQSSALVTYDPTILSKDYIFAQFMEGDKNIMVLEDADSFLSSRTDGNDMMHKFLNVGDGLITVRNKKLIFSTNLPSVKNIDPALLRPGRCFDVLKFDYLTRNQMDNLAQKLGISFIPTKEQQDSDQFSVAELFHQKQKDPITTINYKLGFI